jgi:hypothetical protein
MYARLFLCLSLLAFPASALAETSVVVLGIRSVEGDDDVANDLTEQLRGAARGIEGWAVSSTAVSVAQMSLAHGCEELDAACLTEIAQGLQADRLIYGVVRRTSARDDFDYVVSLNLFDSGTREISRTVTDTIPKSQVDFQSLSAHADRLVGRLSSTASGSAIEIRANVVDADVQINGQHVGTTHEGGLRLQGLRPGQYRIEIRKQGYAPHVSTVTMVEGADTSISAVLAALAGGAPESDAESGPASSPRVKSGGGVEWLGWTMLGLGAVSLIGAGTSMIIVGTVNENELFNAYRGAANDFNLMQAPGAQKIEDVCAVAKGGEDFAMTRVDPFTPEQVNRVASRCSTGATFETLQWVFLGSAVVTTGIGLYIVLTSDNDSADEVAKKRSNFALTPSFGPTAAALTATLRF